jgi:CubicO group peptidase (beta-lactamase class C family)
VQVRRIGLAPTIGTYGWAGGLGTSWANDPTEHIVGVILTTDMFTAAYPAPATIRDFWTGVYASLAD